ncbi:MAG TPA: glycosyltransferase, partial [Thermoanaerobaculia bacterium]|nr:glycosyltransferase [Thermoanaerobaculia bacterium]
AGAEVVLELGGAEATAAALDANRRFRIAHRMGEGERAEAECIVRAGGAELARSGRFAVVARPFALSARAVGDLEAVRAALDPLPAALRDADARDLLRAIVELQPAERGEIEAALAQLAARAAAARSRPAALAPELPPRSERSLRVLFVTTEIPWSGHGGGVSTSNLLRHLGARHELTLLHPVHPGAEGLSEEVRGFVRELVTAPRGWQPAPSPAPYGVPVESLRTFSPELRAAVAAELGSGRYDLANFEFSAASLYAPPAGARDLLVIHESRSFALLAESSPRSGSELDLAAWTARLLAALTFETVELPGRFRDLATLTAPEARCLAAFLPGHRLHVNPIAIDVESLAARSAAAAAPERPTFVYVGNFRHPPNRDAAGVLVDEVAPLLLRRSPGARIVIAGDRAPAELVESARRARVEHLGWVEDLPRLLGGATAFLAPIRTGAGMRVKHLEAMACGCPIVTTALGMSGIAAADGREYLQAESAEELVDGALRLAGDAALRARLASSARELVARDHAPAVQGERRERIWAAVLGAAASRDAG